MLLQRRRGTGDPVAIRPAPRVRGRSGTLYPSDTRVLTTGRGSVVDGFIAGDWLALRWRVLRANVTSDPAISRAPPLRVT